MGALDFAGGTVVHINAGVAGFVGALLLGRRIGYGKEAMPPHSLTLTMVGASLLWVGWFGFNAGSNLEANSGAVLAMANTFVATAAAGLSWMLVEWIFKGKPSLLGLASGVVAGLVAVTPASGYAGPMGALVLGLVAGAICFFFCTAVKSALGYDDTLDVFGVHAIGGFVGAIGTGIVAAPFYGGAGVVDYTKCVVKDGMVTSDCPIGDYDMRLRFSSSSRTRLSPSAGPGSAAWSCSSSSRRSWACGSRPSASARASTSPSMASAPTTCKNIRGGDAPPRCRQGEPLVSPPFERLDRRPEARDRIPGFFTFSSAAPRCKVPLFQVESQRLGRLCPIQSCQRSNRRSRGFGSFWATRSRVHRRSI